MAKASFEASLSLVLVFEGGYVDHPADPGGATNLGITIGTLTRWRGTEVTKADVRAITRKDAGAIYRAQYWNGVRADLLPAGLDLAMFDLAVNSGPARAIKILQSILGLAQDGRWNAALFAQITARDPAELIRDLCAARLAFLKRLKTWPVFGRGWQKRVTRVEREALHLLASSKSLSPTTTEIRPMDMTKSFLTSRTVWANVIGFLAVALSMVGFDTSTLDVGALSDQILQAIAAVSFVASTIFRVVASKRIL